MRCSQWIAASSPAQALTTALPDTSFAAMEVACASCSARNRVPAKRLLDKAKCAQCKAALLPLSRPVALASAQDFDELVRDSPLPVLVDFWAAWCGPCRMVAPEMEKVARDRSERVLVAKVDTEALPAV